MERKRILFTEPNVAQLLTVDCPEPKPGEVLVKMAVSTISSGTERANLVGDVNVSSLQPAKEKPVFLRSGGYSSAGTVVRVAKA